MINKKYFIRCSARPLTRSIHLSPVFPSPALTLMQTEMLQKGLKIEKDRDSNGDKEMRGKRTEMKRERGRMRLKKEKKKKADAFGLLLS